MGFLLCWWFTALRHISCHFGLGQLAYSHCSCASLLGSLQVLSPVTDNCPSWFKHILFQSKHMYIIYKTRQSRIRTEAYKLILPFLNQPKEGNGRRKYFKTNLLDRMFPDVRIEPATVRIPGGRASNRATAPGFDGLVIRKE